MDVSASPDDIVGLRVTLLGGLRVALLGGLRVEVGGRVLPDAA